MKNKISCSKFIIEEFNKDPRMKTAENFKLKSDFTLSTIKSNLCKLKKKNILVIGFRTRGKFTQEISLDGTKKYVQGKCYYKLKENETK